MGLFSSFVKSLTKPLTSVLGALAPVVQAAAPILTAIAPAAGAFFGGTLSSTLSSPALAGVSAINPTPPLGIGLAGQRGVNAVVGAGATNPSCSPGVFGTGGFSNPMARAAVFPGFNTSALPARPLFGFNQQQAFFNPQQQFPQTTSFSTPNFGQSVAPSFRPFTPSFRSGMPSPGLNFQPGISIGSGFQPQFQPQFQQQQFQQPFAFGFGSF